MSDILVVDSATQLDAGSRGRLVACGSHGGLYPAWLAARAGVRAIVLNDAGVGRNGAGTAGVAWLSALGIPACAVDHRSARIGDGADTLASGAVSFANDVAVGLGCAPGLPARDALARLREAPPSNSKVPEIGETRTRIRHGGHRDAWALDSISLTRPADARAVLVTGSHGALLGGRDDGLPPEDVFAVFVNDAGFGKDDAGVARLAMLDRRGIGGIAIACHSARIGDGRSGYDTGVVSRVNEVAARLDLKAGLAVREAVARLVGLA